MKDVQKAGPGTDHSPEAGKRGRISINLSLSW